MDSNGVFDVTDVLPTGSDRLTIACTAEFDANQEYTAIEEIEVYSTIHGKSHSLICHVPSRAGLHYPHKVLSLYILCRISFLRCDTLPQVNLMNSVYCRFVVICNLSSEKSYVKIIDLIDYDCMQDQT